MGEILTLAVLRRRRGWNQIDLAQELGVSQSEVSLWENGYTKPRPEVLARLRELFGVATADELFLDYSEYLLRDHARKGETAGGSIA